MQAPVLTGAQEAIGLPLDRVPHLSRGPRDVDPATVVAAAFETLGPSIRSIVLGAMHDPELAADAVQDAFARLLGEARANRYPHHPKAWLVRTAMNVAISRRRHTAVATRWAPRLACLDQPTPPDAIAIEHERSRELHAALACLLPAERTALLMSASGASGVEIAAHLGKTHGATRSLIHRGRERLRQELAEVAA